MDQDNTSTHCCPKCIRNEDSKPWAVPRIVLFEHNGGEVWCDMTKQFLRLVNKIETEHKDELDWCQFGNKKNSHEIASLVAYNAIKEILKEGRIERKGQKAQDGVNKRTLKQYRQGKNRHLKPVIDLTDLIDSTSSDSD